MNIYSSRIEAITRRLRDDLNAAEKERIAFVLVAGEAFAQGDAIAGSLLMQYGDRLVNYVFYKIEQLGGDATKLQIGKENVTQWIVANQDLLEAFFLKPSVK